MTNRSEARVVSLAPSMTEALFAMGAGELAVGRSSYCDYPTAAQRLPVVGGFADPNVEAILALAPSLVVGTRGPAGPTLAATLGQRGIATFFPPTDNLDEIASAMSSLGERVGHKEGATDLVTSMRTQVERLSAATKKLTAPRTAFLFDFAPLVAAGPGGFPDELLRLAGAENVVVGGGAYPRIDAEGLLALDPDLLIDGRGPDRASDALATLRAHPALSRLRAVTSGRVAVLDTSAALRPGPRYAEGLAALIRIVHGPNVVQSP